MIKYLLLALLVGCASTPPPTAIIQPPEKVVKLDPKSLELCRKLNKVPEDASFEDLLKIDISNLEIYAECAKKQENSVKLLKEFSNYKESK